MKNRENVVYNHLWPWCNLQKENVSLQATVCMLNPMITLNYSVKNTWNDVHQIIYIYIYIWKVAIQLTCVGLAHARPNELRCNIGTLPGCSTSCILLSINDFALRFVLEVFASLLSSVTHFAHVNSELRSVVSGSLPLPNFDLILSGLAPLQHTRKIFFTNFPGVVCAWCWYYESEVIMDPHITVVKLNV